MSFEIYEPHGLRGKTLSDVECSITKHGLLSFNIAVASKIGLSQEEGITIMIDRGTRRLAIKRPAEGDQTFKLRKESRRFGLRVNGALREMGLLPPAEKTIFRLENKSRDGILIVNLDGLPEVAKNNS